MPHRILAIDDNPNLLAIIAEALKPLGYEVECASDGVAGLRKVYETQPDLILLDIMMPGLDGWQVCERVRQMSDVPIIIISALESDDDVAKGLEMGADGYLAKPIPIAELRARVKAVLRRSQGYNRKSVDLEHQGLKINVDQHMVTYQDRPVRLSPTEYNLLVCLMRHKQKTRSIEFLSTEVWGRDEEYDRTSVRLYISFLRRKLKACGAPADLIHTEWGVGYRLD